MSLRRLVVIAMSLVLLCAATARAQEQAVCYNCPPEWADWGSQLALIEKELGIHVPLDNKNSGQSLSQMIAERTIPWPT